MGRARWLAADTSLSPARRLRPAARPHLLLVVNGHASGAARAHRLEHAHSLLVGLGALLDGGVDHARPPPLGPRTAPVRTAGWPVEGWGRPLDAISVEAGQRRHTALEGVSAGFLA